MFEVECVDLVDVYERGEGRYNSNNHYTGVKPEDYFDRIRRGWTSMWVDYYKPGYKKFVINDRKIINLLINANRVSMITGRLSTIFQNELESIDLMNDLFDGKPYFVRCENVSLKYGKHGVGPYYTPKQVLESIPTCIMGHTPLYCDTEEITIYLFDWVDIEFEYRIFLHNKKITAISQQQLNKIIPNINSEDNLNLIVNYFQEHVQNIINQDSYTYDFAILKDKTPYFIEPNCFGKEYPAGSALFHWIIDQNILYGKYNKIYFRYLTN